MNFAKEQNLEYYETSAKTGEGIDNAIKELVKKVMVYINKKNGTDNLKLNENRSKRKCC